MLKQSVKLLATDEQALHWKWLVNDGKKDYLPEITFDKADIYQYRCTCKSKTDLCSHVKAVFETTLEKQLLS